MKGRERINDTGDLKNGAYYQRIPGVRALSDVTIEACKGEILSIVGENGAGKKHTDEDLKRLLSP